MSATIAGYPKKRKSYIRTEEHRHKLSEAIRAYYVREGSKVWNKGLTKETDERVRHYGETGRKTKRDNPQTISEETRKKMSEAHKKHYMQHPERRVELAERMRGTIVLDPLIRKKISDAKIRYYRANPEVREERRKQFIENVIDKGKWGGTNLSTKRTKIEVILENIVKDFKIQYVPQMRVGRDVIDIAIPLYKIALFADGCYWHGCPLHHPNKTYNVDIKVTKRLEDGEWYVIRIWEHDLINISYAKGLLSSFLHLKTPKESTLDCYLGGES